MSTIEREEERESRIRQIFPNGMPHGMDRKIRLRGILDTELDSKELTITGLNEDGIREIREILLAEVKQQNEIQRNI